MAATRRDGFDVNILLQPGREGGEVVARAYSEENVLEAAADNVEDAITLLLAKAKHPDSPFVGGDRDLNAGESPKPGHDTLAPGGGSRAQLHPEDDEREDGSLQRALLRRTMR